MEAVSGWVWYFLELPNLMNVLSSHIYLPKILGKWKDLCISKNLIDVTISHGTV